MIFMTKEKVIICDHSWAGMNNEGRSSVVRNGYLPDREILTGIGSVPVKMPKVRSRAGKPVTIKRNE